MSRNKNYDASSRKRPWADLNDDVLYSVMMQLGVVEFISFSGVCEPWRSLALSNKKKFMACRPPMLLWISEKKGCYLEDFEGRDSKTIIPQLAGRKCVGVSCGYLILFGKETHDFFLVNLITRHQLHFPDFPLHVDAQKRIGRVTRAILVFSSSIKKWVFVMLHKLYERVWFSIAGTGAWDFVSSASRNIDLHFSKGKIYTLSCDLSYLGKHVCELRLHPVPTLEPKIMLPGSLSWLTYSPYNFISSDENLYLIEYRSLHMYKVFKLDFDQLDCVPCEKTLQEYSFFNSYSHMKSATAVKSEAWAASSSLGVIRKSPCSGNPGKGMMYFAGSWYFPHECLNNNLIDM